MGCTGSTRQGWATTVDRNAVHSAAGVGAERLRGLPQPGRTGLPLYEYLPAGGSQVDVYCGSATNLRWLADGSVDYVFTDPPFGANLFYADCNIVWESWLGDVTDHDAEIVVNRSRSVDQGGKTVADYQRLLTDAFKEARRVISPSGRCSVVFHNSDDTVWTALLDAVEAAGLHQAEVSILDKGQRSQKGYKIRRGELVPFYDLVMTFTPVRRAMPHLNGAGEVALDIVTDHLTRLTGNDTPARRGLDYLYSVAVGGVIRSGARPTGLSLPRLRASLQHQPGPSW